jgi:hypothetical protein
MIATMDKRLSRASNRTVDRERVEGGSASSRVIVLTATPFQCRHDCRIVLITRSQFHHIFFVLSDLAVLVTGPSQYLPLSALPSWFNKACSGWKAIKQRPQQRPPPNVLGPRRVSQTFHRSNFRLSNTPHMPLAVLPFTPPMAWSKPKKTPSFSCQIPFPLRSDATLYPSRPIDPG